MTRNTSFTVRTAFGLLAAAALGACDAPQQALGPTLPDGPSQAAGVMYGRYKSGALVICNVTRATLTVQCGSTQAPFGTTPVGGNGVSVKLIPRAVSYNAGTGIFQMSMRIQNLLVNKIGTPNGVAVSGLNAFFYSPPFVTGGSGAVAVANADGTATFTAPNQKYYFYNQMLGLLQQSSNRTWQFNVPSTVTSFRFGIYVSAEILPVVVFDKVAPDGNRDIYRVALDGSDLVRITTNAAVDMDPAVANRTIVFTSYRNGNADIYSVPLGGGAETRLTNTAANELQPAIRFDEANVAYVSDATGVTKLWKRLPDGSHVAMTATFGTPASVEANPFFNPGNNVAFTTTHNGQSADIWMAKTGKFQALITGAFGDVEGSWSADAKRAVFTSDRDGDTEIYIYNLVTLVATRVTNRPGLDHQPSIGPDYKIFYLSYDPTPVLKWKTVAGAATVIPTGAGTPANPAVVQAW